MFAHLSAQRLRKCVHRLGYHWYGDPRYEFWPAREGMLLHENAPALGSEALPVAHEVRKVHELWPEKHIVMTEACQENGPRVGDWKLGERYAEAIMEDPVGTKE